MTNKQLDKFRKKIKKEMIKSAKKQIKSNENLKHVLRELNDHFKKYNWPLDYEHYKVQSGLNSLIFNAALEVKKYKIFYNPLRLNILIRK